jgi:hypothetical protein
MVRTDSRLFSRGRRYLGHSQRKRSPFRLRGCHPRWPAFPDLSAASTVCQILSRRAAGTRYPATPRTQRPPTWHVLRFRLFLVRSPLLTESMARSVPVVTEMFHFATCGSPACAGGTGVNLPPGFPIRKSRDRNLLSGSPWHIAARSVLLRLWEPRHPPCTLSSLSAFIEIPRPCDLGYAADSKAIL